MSTKVNGRPHSLKDAPVVVCAICEWPFDKSLVGLSCVGHIGVHAKAIRSRELLRSVVQDNASEHLRLYGR